MESSFSDKREALTELHSLIVDQLRGVEMPIGQYIPDLSQYYDAGDAGVYALLGMLYHNPPSFADAIYRAGIYTEENSGLPKRAQELGSVLLGREVTWNDPQVLQKIIAGDNAIELSPEAFDKLTDMIENPPEPNQTLINLMRQRVWPKGERVIPEGNVESIGLNHKIQQSGISGMTMPKSRPNILQADFDGDTPSGDVLSFGWMCWTPATNEELLNYVGRYARIKRPGSALELHRRCYNNLSMKKKYAWKKGYV